MARFTFGGTDDDYIHTVDGGGVMHAAPGSTLTFWSAVTGGTQYTDLLLSGSPVTTITADTRGYVPQFSGPDGISQMWASADGSARVLYVSQVNSLGFVQLPVTADKVVYVSNRGNDSNNGQTWATALLTVQAAITKLGGPGIIELGQGAISTASSLSLGQSGGVTIRGRSGTTSGATPATTLTFTGTGSGSFIDARSSTGFVLQDVMVLYSSSSFTGRLIDLRDDGAHGNTTFATIRDCYLGGASGIRTADCLVDISNTHSLRFERTQFRSGAVHGLRGKNTSTDTANSITLTECYFNDNTTTHIRNPGDGWTLIGCTFEALHSGAAGAVICDTNTACNSLSVLGGWAGDVIAAAGGIQYDLTGNNILLATFIGGNTGSTGVKLRNNSGTAPGGITIASRFDGTATAIDYAGVTPLGYDFARSSYAANVTTQISGGTAAPVSMDVTTGIPTIVKRNRSASDSRVVDRYQSDASTVQVYDVGIDPDGSTNKRWAIRDITRNAICFFADKLGNVVAGASGADLGTTATDGFFYLPTVNGTPTGTPTAYTGAAPAVVDRSTNKLYVRVGGTWKSVTLT